MRTILCVFLIIPASMPGTPARAQQKGIAEKYPGDKGIIGNKHVIFADNFERGDFKRWGENQHPTTTAIHRGKKHVHAGRQSVQMTAVIPGSSGGGLIKWFDPGLDRMHARFYVKFAKDCNYVHHFVHIVAGRGKWGGFGQAGKRPNGTDFFSTGIEPAGRGGRVPPPGVWHFYTYWPDMRGRYGTGFAPEKPIPVPRDKWVCVEMMLKCNTAPGKSDGEQAFWINGKLAGRFKDFRWRTTNDLKINAFWLLYYVTPGALRRCRAERMTGRFTVWFDDVVVATRYIGPMKQRGSSGSKPGGKISVPPGWEK